MDLKDLFPEEETSYPIRPLTPEITYPYPLYKSSNSKSKTLLLKPNQVNFVVLHGIRIVSLIMEGKERLCLAQISNTLLKDYSYNEIHNRRVALGITCVQCTPVQLEILRRAGAMPISSRRCGMITKREAERLCKSFLGDNSPPKLPDNFAFEVYHECAWGCRGQFVPSRYNSSRAKCIKCHYCSIFFSPNKFVFHSHRVSDSDKYVQPDAANFNSWRRHTKLLGDPPDEVVYAWEDIKAMFNGGTRKRMSSSGNSVQFSSSQDPESLSSSTNNNNENKYIKFDSGEEVTPPSSSCGRKRKNISNNLKTSSSPINLAEPSCKVGNIPIKSIQPPSSLQEPNSGGSLPDYFWPPPPTFPFSYPFLWPHPPPLPHGGESNNSIKRSATSSSILPSLQHLGLKHSNIDLETETRESIPTIKKSLEEHSRRASSFFPPKSLYHAENLLKAPLRPGSGLDFMHWIETRRSFMDNNPLLCANRMSAFKPLHTASSSTNNNNNNETCEVSTTVDKEDDRNEGVEEVIDVETTADEKIKKEKLDEPHDFSVQKIIK
ncbi:uncharacterized protein [Lepeophtheirus salmonis]|uniref:uncharacterized protein isoform X2 n=1 Tax=Lepeophtheirus salmonis TaxID=72036 RepID=UPI001AE34D6F|nr:SKI family transcriptional corepressor 1 homolog-B-like isoform X2 [Lepeophtheirus salmonis]